MPYLKKSFTINMRVLFLVSMVAGVSSEQSYGKQDSCDISLLMGVLGHGQTTRFGKHFDPIIRYFLKRKKQILQRLSQEVASRRVDLEFNLHSVKNRSVDLEARTYAQALLKSSRMAFDLSVKRLRDAELYYEKFEALRRGESSQDRIFSDGGFVAFQQELVKRAIAQDRTGLTEDSGHTHLLSSYGQFLDRVTQQ